MRLQGRITDWKDAQGFGFITPSGGGDRVFVHIKSFPRGSRRPVEQDRVNYSTERDDQGRLRAKSVALVVEPDARYSRINSRSMFIALAVAFISLLAMLAALGWLPVAIVAVYLLMSAVTFAAYAFDKAAARSDRWRTAENTLHLLGLLGGWPGGLLAQQTLRHKSKKRSFIAVFWVSVAANVSALFWLLLPHSDAFLRSLTEGGG